jgi:hypothetical protein
VAAAVQLVPSNMPMPQSRSMFLPEAELDVRTGCYSTVQNSICYEPCQLQSICYTICHLPLAKRMWAADLPCCIGLMGKGLLACSMLLLVGLEEFQDRLAPLTQSQPGFGGSDGSPVHVTCALHLSTSHPDDIASTAVCPASLQLESLHHSCTLHTESTMRNCRVQHLRVVAHARAQGEGQAWLRSWRRSCVLLLVAAGCTVTLMEVYWALVAKDSAAYILQWIVLRTAGSAAATVSKPAVEGEQFAAGSAHNPCTFGGTLYCC